MSKKAAKLRLTTAQRGYGEAHRRLRKLWSARIAAGGVDCARCGNPIDPGSRWDLGHDDHDRSVYQGPEHRKCNRATAGRLSLRLASRKW